jgi:hypothetical protein
MVHDSQRLRRRRRSRGPGPLASFLLVGGEGVGKRYLVRVITKLLCRDGAVNVVACERATAAQLLESLHSRPSPTVLLEHIDRASADTQMLIGSMLKNGRATIQDREVCLDGVLVVLSTTACEETLSRLTDEVALDGVLNGQAISVLESEGAIDSGLIAAVTGVFHLLRPNDETKAEVAALLMKKECASHDIELLHVDPEIVATQVIQWSDACGFGAMPQRIGRLLRRPLIAASESGQRVLSLRVSSTSQLANSRP